ncbi:hypothetical protein AB0A77_04905 [Streptomyces varsoviensis]|uniref:hypothetical protein n=1 Tax=Streptomyces varsoviensis TaxID=67373 RepID=UPI0033E19C70
MPVDPTDPDTFDEDPDSPENADDATGPRGDGASEIDVEAPEADTAEQRADLTPHRDAPLSGVDTGTADPGDAAEQARVVDTDEDDYR